MSLLLSVQSGEKVTPAQLLGEEAEELESREAEAEREAEALIQRVREVNK
jgi:hypothetical protein